MRRSGGYDPEPEEEVEESILDRLRGSWSRLRNRLTGNSQQQALPFSSYRGQTGPVTPYHERRQQLLRSRTRQHSSYAAIFAVVLVILVGGVFFALTWALGGLSFGGGSRSSPTAVTAGSQAASAGTQSPVVLPTAAPGGSSPSPSPGASPGLAAPGKPGPGAPSLGAPGPAAPSGGRTYVVKPGDNPGTIARQFGVTAEAIMRANDIADARTLRVGDTLTIPPESTPTPVTKPQ